MRVSFVSLLGLAGLATVACAIDDTTASSTQPLDTLLQLSDFALYADVSLSLGEDSSVVGGDIGVLFSAPGAGAQLLVQDHATVDVARRIVAPSVSLGKNATVGNILTNALTNNGAHSTGTVGAFPVAMPAPPLAVTFSSGADINVADHASAVLTPNTYGALAIGSHSNVTLQPGDYSFASVSVSDHSAVSASGVVNLGIAGTLSIGTESRLVATEAVNEFETHAFMSLVTNGNSGGRVDVDG